MEFQTGQPFTLNTSFDRNLDGNLTDRLDSLQGIQIRPGKAHSLLLGSGTNPIDLVAELGSAGRVGRNTIRSDGIAVVDIAVNRRFELNRELSLDLRFEVFNLFNDTSYGIPIRILESPGFGIHGGLSLTDWSS